MLGALVRESAELATKLSQLCQRGLRDLSAIQLLEFVGVEVPDEVELHRQLQVCPSEQGHGIITAEDLHKDAVCIREEGRPRFDAGPVLDTKVEFGQLQDSPQGRSGKADRVSQAFGPQNGRPSGLERAFPLTSSRHPVLKHARDSADGTDAVWEALLRNLPMPWSYFADCDAFNKPAVWPLECYHSELSGKCSDADRKLLQDTSEDDGL